MKRRDAIIGLSSGLLGSVGGIGTYEWLRRRQLRDTKDNNPDNSSDNDSDEPEIETIEEKENALNSVEDAESYGALGYFSQETISDLQSGGYILYVRHEETQSGRDQHKTREVEVSGTDEIPEWDFDDCSLQRNLNINGWRRAANTGKAIDMLDISFDDVLASPWCRCRKTAELMLGDYAVSSELNYENENNLEDIREIFNAPNDGQNTAMFAHSLGSMESDVLLEDFEDSRFNEGHALVLDPSIPLESSVIDGPGIDRDN